MNTKELLIDFIEYAKSRHITPILHSNIEPLVDDYLSSKNDGKPIVSRSKCDYHAAFTFCGDNGITYCSNCGDPV